VCAGEDRKHSLLSHSLGFSFTWDSVDLFSSFWKSLPGQIFNVVTSRKIPTPRCVVPVAASAGGMGGIFCKNAQTAPPRHGRDIRARVRGARTTMTTGIKDQGAPFVPLALLDAEHPSSVKSPSLAHPRRWRGGTSANHSASHRRTTRTSRDYRTSGGRSRVRRGGWRATALDRTTLGRRGGGDTIPTGNDSLVVVGGGCIGRWSKLRSNLTCYARQRGRRD